MVQQVVGAAHMTPSQQLFPAPKDTFPGREAEGLLVEVILGLLRA